MNFWLISPEIALTVLAILVLALDLIFIRAERKGWLGWAAAIGVVAVIVWTVYNHSITPVTRIPKFPVSFLGGFLPDTFTFVFHLLILAVAALSCLAGVGFANKHLRWPGEFFSLILFSALGFMFMVAAGDLIMLYLGLELGTLSLYALAALQKDKPRSGEAGLKFLIMGAVSSAVFLYGASLIYGSLHSVVFVDMYTRSDITGSAEIIGLVMIIAALGFKITAVPFHMWAPDVYQGAPTPITGFMSVASKAAGFGALMRLLLGPFFAHPFLGIWSAPIMFISGLSMIAGNLIALPQSNIKRMLAYSGIAQAGYVLIAVLAGSQKGIAAASFFLLQYAFTNLGAFIVVTIVGSAQGNDEIRSYAGLSRRNPLLAFSMLILLLSLGGIPPLSGFWGKLFLFWAGIEQGQYLLVLVGVLATVVSLYYYLMVAKQMYIDDPDDTTPIPVSRSAALALGICTAVVFALGYPTPLWNLVESAAKVFTHLQ
jgi:NADH-quinone oxidoreductase subunit N